MNVSQELISDWKARIDEITTRLMIGADAPELAAELKALASQMRENRADALHTVLEGCIALLEDDLERGTAHLLETGIAELQASVQDLSLGELKRPASLIEDPELVSEFVVESREHLSQIEGQMLALERDPGSMEVIHAIFRAFHTIKGIAGFLEFPNIQELSHEVETLLDLARNAIIAITPSIVDVILESGDFLSQEVSAIERFLQHGEQFGPGVVAALCSRIRLLATGANRPHIALAATPDLEEGTGLIDLVLVTSGTAEAPPGEGLQAELASETAAVVEKTISGSEPEPEREPIATATSATEDCQKPCPTPSPGATSQPYGVTKSAGPMKTDEVLLPSGPVVGAQKEATRSKEGSSVRVDTSKLDHLLDMVGEMVIAQSLIRHNGVLTSITDSRFLGDLSQLARATAEVQRATMSMRMVPVGSLFQRVERVVRDLSRRAGKRIVLETQGTETGIDKTVAEELADPLLHMVRNSIDHGIELPEERVANGKTADACIRLAAYHQGGQVIISISDDGRGLDPQKIRRKAEEREIVAPGAQLSEAEIFQLIFEPGFSTAEKITDVSGRGVGMDVVRRNVEKLRGRIEPESLLGQGTTFLLKLPLTLAIIDGLVVAIGTERFILPLSGVREMFRPAEGSLFTVEGRDEMLLVRGGLMPLARLDERLGIQGRAKHPCEGLVVVLESAYRRFGLVVDDLIGKQEVVIKGLGESFRGIAELSGCAILGDGRVGLILDIDGLYRGRR